MREKQRVRAEQAVWAEPDKDHEFSVMDLEQYMLFFVKFGWRLIISGGGLVLLLTGCAEPQLEDLRQFVATTKASAPRVQLEPPPQIEEYVPFAYTAQGLKDPFAPSSIFEPPKSERETTSGGFATVDPVIDSVPCPDRPKMELEKYSLGALQMVGTFYQEGELWALIRAPDGIIHRVQEGNYLGTNYGQITNITEQRIDLVEIVREGEVRCVKRDASLALVE